jgi:hypothetical protein
MLRADSNSDSNTVIDVAYMMALFAVDDAGSE